MRTSEIEEVVNALLKLKAEGKSKDFIDSLSDFSKFRTTKILKKVMKLLQELFCNLHTLFFEIHL
jgi:hypothetical protein